MNRLNIIKKICSFFLFIFLISCSRENHKIVEHKNFSEKLAEFYLTQAKKESDPYRSGEYLLKAGKLRLNVQGKEKKGIKDLKLACEISRSDKICAQSSITLGDFYFYKGNCDESIEKYYIALGFLKNNEESKHVIEKIGNCLLKKGNYYQLKISLKKFRDKGIDSDQIEFLLAEAEENLGNTDLAIHLLEGIISRSKNTYSVERAYRRLIGIYESADNIKEALRVAKKAINKGIKSNFIVWKFKKLKKRLNLRKGR